MANTNNIRFSAPCHFGLEKVLRFEVTRIGGENITVQDGRVSWTGDFNTLARANIGISVAERIQILLAEYKAETFEELFEGMFRAPLEQFIGKEDAFPIKGHSLNSTLHSIPACQKILKKAAVKRLQAAYKTSEFLAETGSLHQLQFTILKNQVSIYLDTTGAGLHKRGYRRNSNLAPIRETLAAGILDLARLRSDTIVCDPFCGSGTFLIEAARRACKIAPGLDRRFIAEQWDCVPKSAWQEARSEALDRIDRSVGFEGYGFDIDPEAIRLTMDNAKKAGVDKFLHIEQRDIRDFKPIENAVTICNPPYGERMLELEEARKIYEVMGKVIEAPAYIICGDDDFERRFGRKADKRRKLYNGMISCQLYCYYNK
ncbi:MAG: class I SAM-dependent RNA methyltransferase [Oscillospiraceae bacterium]|nr:class I SAM-dependent RNA methyltransferase [Oscillospiraceae bacterium]